jgi:uncharacterized Zn finger protein
MSEVSVAQLLGERAEAELRRVRAARPHLGSRCERAEGILVSHLACGGSGGVIRARVRGGELVGFLVRGSGGSVYRVEPWGSWRCSCPDHHRRGKACKHALACWALWRASARPAAAEEPEASPAGIAAAPRRRSVRPSRVRREAELPVVSPERLGELAERLGVA